jgi:hypothetical protein
MRTSLGRRQALLISFAVAAAMSWCARAEAVEPVNAFLEGLRRRQMYDMAQAYLESLRSSTLVSDDVKKIIPYEQGKTLVEEARTLRDVGLRMKRLDEARQQLETFVQANPEHELAAEAGTQLGNILLERGRTQLELSKRPTQAGRKDQLVAEARELLKSSQEVFDAGEAKYAEQLKRSPRGSIRKSKHRSKPATPPV